MSTGDGTVVRTRGGHAEGEGERRTERTPAQTFLGAFAPRPSPVTTAPPGMIERKALVWGWETTCT